jgi:hypothetical protein
MGVNVSYGYGEGKRPSGSILKVMSYTLFGNASAPMIMEGPWLKQRS